MKRILPLPTSPWQGEVPQVVGYGMSNEWLVAIGVIGRGNALVDLGVSLPTNKQGA